MGSGKSYWAESQTVSGQIVQVNRDYVRKMLHFGYQFGNGPMEEVVTAACNAAVKAALNKGLDVIVSDTNINPDIRNLWQKMAKDCNADYIENWDFVKTPLEVCIERNSHRTSYKVPNDVIESAWRKAKMFYEGKLKRESNEK